MNSYQRQVLPAPVEIVSDGHCAMGTYNSPIQNVNLTELKRPLGFSAPSAWNQFRLKEWQAYQISNEDWFICLAIYNTKSLGTAIIMAFNKQEQKMYQYEQKAPAWKINSPKGLFGTHCYYHGRKITIDFNNQLENNLLNIEFKAVGFKGLPDLSGKFTAFHTTEPIVIVQPFSDNRPLYSHKALMSVQGSFTFGENESLFSKSNGCVIVDDHKGYYPYVMQYDWVTALGFHEQHGMVGFNLTDNQIQDPERYNENCLWLNGKMLPLPPVKIDRPQGVERSWVITDKYQQVDLTFTPIEDVPVKLNVGLAKVDYHGPTGQFSGYILDADGNKITFDHFIGMGEKKYVRL